MLKDIIKNENKGVPGCFPKITIDEALCPGQAVMLAVVEENFETFKAISNIGIVVSTASLISVIS